MRFRDEHDPRCAQPDGRTARPSTAAPLGLVMEGTFGNASRCALVANDLAQAEPAIYLGPRTRGCRVVNTTPGAVIIDDGTDNEIVGR